MLFVSDLDLTHATYELISEKVFTMVCQLHWVIGPVGLPLNRLMHRFFFGLHWHYIILGWEVHICLCQCFAIQHRT